MVIKTFLKRWAVRIYQKFFKKDKQPLPAPSQTFKHVLVSVTPVGRPSVFVTLPLPDNYDRKQLQQLIEEHNPQYNISIKRNT